MAPPSADSSADPVSALRSALSPRRGMRRVPLALQSAQHPSLPASTQRLVNLVAEPAPPGGRSEFVVVSSPGLTTEVTLGTGPVWACNQEIPGGLYAVSGTRAYFHDFDNPPVDLGDVGIPALDERGFDTLMRTIAVSSTQVAICVPPRVYVGTHGGGSLALAPFDAYSVAEIAGYFVYGAADSSAKFFWSGLLDAATVDPLAFLFADQLPGSLRRVVSHRGDLWLFGATTIQIFGLGGNPDIPFVAQPGGTIPGGTNSVHSIATGDGSVWWVSDHGIVYRSSGYQPVRVSTYIQENLFGSVYTTATFIFTLRGHVFYVVTSPAVTWAYDASTKLWLELTSAPDGAGPWRCVSACGAGSGEYLGDSLSGAMFVPFFELEGEDAVPSLHRMTLPTIWAGTRRGFAHRIEIEMETGAAGSDPAVTLELSRDGGFSFPVSRTLDGGAPGARGKRVFATRLGSFRQLTLRLATRGRIAIYAVDIDIDIPGDDG